MATSSADLATPERAARRALGGGAALLVLGLAAVGVGQADEGAALSLCGLVITIYGIHRFGRLGPEEPPGRAPDLAAAPVDAMWIGGLALVMGLALVAGAYLEGGPTAARGPGLLAWAALVAGAARLATGYLALENVKRTKAKVEKRRRLDKSPAP